jgi:hypothetical protein
MGIIVQFLLQWEKFFSYIEIVLSPSNFLLFRLTDELKSFGITVEVQPPFFRLRHNRLSTSVTSVTKLASFLNLYKVMYSTSTLWKFQDRQGCTIMDPNSKNHFLHLPSGQVKWPFSEQGETASSAVLYFPDLVYAISAVSLAEAKLRFALDGKSLSVRAQNMDGDIDVRISTVAENCMSESGDLECCDGQGCSEIFVMSGLFKTLLSSVSKCKFALVSIENPKYHGCSPLPAAKRTKSSRQPVKHTNETSKFLSSSSSCAACAMIVCVANSCKYSFQFLQNQIE